MKQIRLFKEPAGTYTVLITKKDGLTKRVVATGVSKENVRVVIAAERDKEQSEQPRLPGF